VSTYTPIASTTLASATASVTFNNLPQNYQSLRIVVDGRGTAGTGFSSFSARYNNDSTSLYSRTIMSGIGSGSGTSSRGSNETAFYFGFMTDPSTSIGLGIFEINNYAIPSVFKTAIVRWGYASSAANLTETTVGLYRSNEPITSITIFEGAAATMAVGTTIDIYGFEAGTPKASGGQIITTDGTYYYHTFTGSGTFTPNQALTNVDFLVLAGGGGSGEFSPEQSGGGGAGGLRSSISPTGGGASPESKLSFNANTTYVITVGGGGARGSNGGASSISGTGFTTLTSIGGGKGSLRGVAAGNGGSGGGGGDYSGTGGTGETGQGFAGGNGTADPAGSGGGAGGAGQNGSFTRGIGVSNSITGSAVTYGTGGSGGGSGVNGAASSPNIGKGGDSGDSIAYAGGSGVVIVRYAV
jgi:hypothetical protein